MAEKRVVIETLNTALKAALRNASDFTAEIDKHTLEMKAREDIIALRSQNIHRSAREECEGGSVQGYTVD